MITDSLRYTPLHVACEWGQVEGTTYLLESGAEPASWGNVHVLPILAVPETDLSGALSSQKAGIRHGRRFTLLVSRDVWSACGACWRGCQIPICKVRLPSTFIRVSRWIKLYPLDGRGRSPLRIACEAGHLDFIKLLLQYEPDCKLPGKSALLPTLSLSLPR